MIPIGAVSAAINAQAHDTDKRRDYLCSVACAIIMSSNPKNHDDQETYAHSVATLAYSVVDHLIRMDRKKAAG